MSRIDYNVVYNNEIALESEESLVLHWVVQRNAQTGALITFRSFSDYTDALRHKTELETIADPLDRVTLPAIESFPAGESPPLIGSDHKRGL